MATVLNQPSFSAGEVSPSLYSRTDLAMYRTALARAENWFVSYHGGIKRRSGLRLVDQAKVNGSVVLIPFAFSTLQTYVLELGEEYIRIIANGAYVESGGSPVELVTPYQEEDLDRITYTQSADVLTLFHKSYPVAQVNRTSSTTFTYTEYSNNYGPFEDVNTDTADTIYADAQSGTVNLVANFSAFNDNVVGKYLYLDQQTSGQIRSWIQRMGVSVGDKCYYAGNYYEANTAETYSGNLAQTGDNPPTHVEGEVWDGPGTNIPDDNRDAIIGVEWSYLHSGFGIVRIDSYSDANNAVGTVIMTIPESIIGGSISSETWTFPNETTQTLYTLSSPDPTSLLASDYEVELQENGGSGVVALSYLTDWIINFSTNQVTLLDTPDNLKTWAGTSDVVVTQKASTRETYKWAFEPWRDDSGYPQCGTYYQQRFALASSLELPQTIWMSVTDVFNSFLVNKTILADDAITYNVNSLQVNEIYHMAPLNALLAFTSGGVWSINQGSNDTITPESKPSVRIQSYDGSSPLRPIIIGTTGLYVQDGSQIVRDIGYDFSSDAFVGTDLTVRASHLFEGRTIVSWAYAKNPDKLIIVVFDDGEMAAFTYLREQQVWGWCPFTTDGIAKSVAVVREGSVDILYVVVEREGVNYIERMEEWYKEDDRDQFFVDSGLTYDGREETGITMTITASDYTYPNECTVTASSSYFDVSMEGRTIVFEIGETKSAVLISEYTSATEVAGVIQSVIQDEIQGVATTDWGLGATTFTGLDHLEGKTVSILSDGADAGDQVVSSGSVTIQSPGVVVHVGLPYSSIAQTLDVEVQQAPETARTKRKIIGKVYANVRNTKSITAGTGLDRLYDLSSRENEDYGVPPRNKTEIIEIPCDDAWGRQGRVYIVQDRPVSSEILAIMPEVTISER